MKSRGSIGTISTIYTKKNLENLEEMSKCLDSFDQPKLNQEDINDLNWYIRSDEIEVAIVTRKRKGQDLNGFSAEFYKTFKEEYQYSSNFSMN
jgi:hypothetical protein